MRTFIEGAGWELLQVQPGGAPASTDASQAAEDERDNLSRQLREAKIPEAQDQEKMNGRNHDK